MHQLVSMVISGCKRLIVVMCMLYFGSHKSAPFLRSTGEIVTLSYHIVQVNLGSSFNCPTALPSNYKPAESGIKVHIG